MIRFGMGKVVKLNPAFQRKNGFNQVNEFKPW
jgi:hypothetical protein